MNDWIVVQIGYVVFGNGLTKEDAVTMAKEYLDKDHIAQAWDVADFKSLASAVDGELVLCRWFQYIEYMSR
tara:strand:- start:225 stop:437 length:213 start_codon:yes stop_codon:yes gene_type:complete